MRVWLRYFFFPFFLRIQKIISTFANRESTSSFFLKIDNYHPSNMNKIFFSLMAFCAITLLTACSSDDNEGTGTPKKQRLTFTATQEGTPANTKTVIADNTKIHWQSDDKICIPDGTESNEFKLTSGEGTKSAIFEGYATPSSSYTAVYPYTATAALEADGTVTGITLPATQTATANSFDPQAALMMAVSNGTTLAFKNVVAYLKLTPKFACSKIVLKAADETAVLAGTGKLAYNNGIPTIDLSEATDKSYAITLTGNIEADKAYYIAVPAVTLTAGWKLFFTTADDSKVYAYTGNNALAFERNIVANIGEFSMDNTPYEPRGEKVGADQEVDMGLEVTISGTKYKVIFAKSNLTATGLAANEYDYGDYFAWAATEPWYTSITTSSSSVTVDAWKEGKSGGYVAANAPYYVGSGYSKYTSAGNTLELADDAASQILGGNWQLPTKEIWKALWDANTNSVYWGSNGDKYLEVMDGIQGMKITKIDDSSTYLFLPAANYFDGTRWSNYYGSYGCYWSGTADSSTGTCYLFFDNSGTVFPQNGSYRFYGFTIRPVRLVAVE